MPELPEVQTIVGDLKTNIVGYKIPKVIIAKKYSVLPDTNTFEEFTINSKVTNVERVAKNIVLHLDNKHFIRVHLAMTGRVLLREINNKTDKWVRVIFVLQKGKEQKHLRYCDMRMFGKIEFMDGEAYKKLFKKYGPEILDKTLTTEKFLEIIKNKNTNIKNLLLDQKQVSGLGNIYASDALFLSRINPKTKTSKITYDQANKLLKSARKVLEKGIKNRGSTLFDKMFVDIFGKEGSHQNHFEIYSKDT